MKSQMIYIVLILLYKSSMAEKILKPIVKPAYSKLNKTMGRSLDFVNEDLAARDSGYYYQYPSVAPSYGPPVYGPPTEQPEGNVEILFLFNELIIECRVESPYEHIIWTRFPCPNQLYFGDGIHVADGATVYNEDLYDVQITGFNGVYYSTLTIRDPTGPESSGLYRCEAWPHIHGNGNSYQPYGTYPYYSSAQSDVFIIGGNSLQENCYGNLAGYPSFGNKVTEATTNKKPSLSQADKESKIKENKLRRNMTRHFVDRKDTNAKYLRYNIKFNNNPSFTKGSNNFSVNGFVPSMKFPSEARHYSYVDHTKGLFAHRSGNVTNLIRTDSSENAETLQQPMYTSTKVTFGKEQNDNIESLTKKLNILQNKTRQ